MAPAQGWHAQIEKCKQFFCAVCEHCSPCATMTRTNRYTQIFAFPCTLRKVDTYKSACAHLRICDWHVHVHLCMMFFLCYYPKGFATLRESAMQRRRASRSRASPMNTAPREKLMWQERSPVGDISVVTLIRTDTTLDHSQKAEKVWILCIVIPAWVSINVFSVLDYETHTIIIYIYIYIYIYIFRSIVRPSTAVSLHKSMCIIHRSVCA